MRASVFAIVAALSFLACNGEDTPICEWCEAPHSGCDESYFEYVQGRFQTSLSPSLDGRGIPYWRPASQPFLGESSPGFTQAVFVHHGEDRDGVHYAAYMANAVLLAGMDLDTTLVFAPQIYEPGDSGLDESTMLWWESCSTAKCDWRWGGNSSDALDTTISNFQVYDEMLRKLADKKSYPDLERVVLFGHSAGGQTYQRYALFTQVGSEDLGELPVDYFVADPSSYTYINELRPVQAEDKTCNFCDNTTLVSQVWKFAVPHDSCHGEYNLFGYGLEGDLPAYMQPASSRVPLAVEQYAQRRVTYVSGNSDVCDTAWMKSQGCVTCQPQDSNLDTSCPAEQQGWCRMSRAYAYAQYVQFFYGNSSTHDLVAVPDVGHNGCGLIQSPQVLDLLVLPDSDSAAGAMKDA